MQLPVFQNFDCHSCAHCCYAVVNVTPGERDALRAAGWEQNLSESPLFIEYRFGGRRLIRLARREDGACAFLGDDRRCRIHAESGAGLKPFACRLFPFVPVPGVGELRLDLRGDCPSIAANRGRKVSAHRAEALSLAREQGVSLLTASPPWNGIRLDASEYEALIGAIDACLTSPSLPPRGRLRAAAHLLDLLHAARPRRVRGERLIELMTLLSTAAIEQAQAPAVEKAPPRRVDHLFRQWLFLHAIVDDPRALDSNLLERLLRSWRRYAQVRRFARGVGDVPPIRDDWAGLTFEQVAAIAPAPDEAFEPLIRAMRVKLHAQAFAGPAYFHYDLLPGLAALLMAPALVGFFARVIAARAGRTGLTADDVLEGLRQVFHTFGVSPVFARISERMRLVGLARPGAVTAINRKYSP